jgi:hypothetical protein
MAALSGGLDGYWTTLRGETAAVTRESSFLVPAQLAVNTGRMALYLNYGLLLGVVPLAWAAWQTVQRWRISIRDRRIRVLALWITPALLFYLVVHLRQHGHVFIFLPAMLLLSGWGIRDFGAKLRRERSQRAVLVVGTAALLLVNVTFFLGVPASLLNSARLPLQTPGWRTIKQRDQFLEARIKAIETRFDPATTAILAKGMYFRHPDYYLREFRHPGLGYQAAEGPVLLEDEVETLVLFDAQAEQLVDSAALLHVPLTTGDRLAYLHRPVQRTVVVSQDTIQFSSSP